MSELVSVIVPVHNESAVLDEFHRQLGEVMGATGCAYEIIYIDDGSSDDSIDLLNGIRQRDCRVALIELSRNFGKEVAL